MFEILKDLCLIILGGTVGFFTAALFTVSSKKDDIGDEKILGGKWNGW